MIFDFSNFFQLECLNIPQFLFYRRNVIDFYKLFHCFRSFLSEKTLKYYE